MNARKVLIIVGMGPELGMATARRFGREGYRLGLIARNADRLAGYAAQLASENIEATSFVADVCNRPQLEAALDQAKAALGRIDALEYSPMINGDDLRNALSLSPESIMPMMEHVLYGAVAAANRVLPDMIARGDGVLLFTDGVSAITPLPSHTNVGVAMAALHRYVETLNISLADTGVYAGEFVISARLPHEEFAEILWDMAAKRDRASVVVGQWQSLAAYEVLVARGYGRAHNPILLQPLPEPRDEAERNIFLFGLYHMSKSCLPEHYDDAEQGKVRREVERLGGDFTAERFGAALP